MKSKINFAIIGCGSVSKKHLEALKQLKDVSLVAVCDCI